MIWFLVLHIGAMLFWCAALLYLPLIIMGQVRQQHTLAEAAQGNDGLPRFLFTHIATPAALAAIITGTLVFLLDRNADAWLILKLTLVAGLVVCHTLTGLLVLRSETDRTRLIPWCRASLVVQLVLMTGILWLVLAKPDVELPI
ncbi:MAG: CopD family protein [Natronospirillum sp.]|uniref:CopD family protein n=1 Tax=Natronospirillum sp. TaxID=2812955 RepID=UPI0025F674E5|nr:CopD family protein [Natronospirillum sp.]MCH8553346.1 CopD family protein [Natronospirillum sp.]